MLLACVCFFASCNQNNPENMAGNHDMTKPEYTIMFYTVGGGDLDYSTECQLVDGLRMLFNGDVSVRFFVQMKYSNETTYWKKMSEKHKTQAELDQRKIHGGEFSTVYRYELLPSMLSSDKQYMNKLPQSAKYGNQGDAAAFYEPDSIASFINYCKAANPKASKYILILSDHGGGYFPSNDYDKAGTTSHSIGKRRSVCFDPELNNYSISLEELRDGIKKSALDKKLDLIFYDCCLMNMIENMGDLAEVTDYVLASGHSTSGCDYGNLINQLYYTLGNYQSQIEAFINYTDDCSAVHQERYKNGSDDVRDYYVDWALTQTSKIPAVLTDMKSFTDAVCNYFDKETLTGSELYNKYAIAANYPWKYVDIYAYYDLLEYAYALADLAQDQAVTTAYENLRNSVNNAIIRHSFANNIKDMTLSFSINIGAKGYICVDFNPKNSERYCYGENGKVGIFNPQTGEIRIDEGNTYANAKYSWQNSYEKTVFDQQTGWTRWLRKNPAMPYKNRPDDQVWDTNGIR